MKLLNKNVIITGASQGLGLAIAEQFLNEGYSLFLCARDKDALEKAREGLLKCLRPGRKICVLKADVSKKEDVIKLTNEALRELGRIDVLVNNAGVYGPKGLIEDVDLEEWVRAVEINLLGTVMMCKMVLPHMKRNGWGKIINLSGGGATSPLPRISAYATSKAGVVRFTETIAEECRGTGIDINAVAPGALNTRLLDEVLTAGPEKVGQSFYDKALKQLQSGGSPLFMGASLCLFLASPASDGITGKLISAVWDPWERLAYYQKELSESDIYALRRIVPEDRGLNWGNK
ncbi:MAG: SDR family NAD(P)-dependent oxidoreductase [Desulfocucumaceae bacterium]